MILRQILVVLFLLAKESNAAVPSLSDLNQSIRQLSIKDTNPVLTLEEIISQGDVLRARTVNDDIETVVSKLNQQLLGLLDSGITLLDAAPIINCFFFDAKELVLAAVKAQAYTLLKTLQLVYIWRDVDQFHWFQALSYNSLWYEEEWWSARPMDWENNLWSICEWDNGALAVAMQKKISSKRALNIFNSKLVLQCVRNDAIKVFEATQMDPMMLGEHVGLLAVCGSVKLLRFYQSVVKTEHLHLEEYPLPEKFPTNVDDFAFLVNQGYDCLPMAQLIERICKQGRLDLLQYLYGLESKLLPHNGDLMLAAENGWLNILQWARNSIRDWGISKSLAIKLAANERFRALEWLVNEFEIIIDDKMITKIIITGKLKALQWIYEKQPFGYKPGWINLAAEKCHLSVLKWLCGTFKLAPTPFALRNATVEMLDWIKVTHGTLINAKLVEHGADNLELLQWAHKNAPAFIFDRNKFLLSQNIHDKSMMEWLYNTLRIRPISMDWAYEAGDLEAIQWALKNFQAIPKAKNIVCAIENGRLNIIKWIHENYPEYLEMSEALRKVQRYGSWMMVDFIASKFGPSKIGNLTFKSDSTDLNYRLDVLTWMHKRKYTIGGYFLSREVDIFASSGQFQHFLRFIEAFPGTMPSWSVLRSTAKSGHHEIYKWHLENCSMLYQKLRFKGDIQVAFVNGHLEIVKLILHKCPKHYEDISNIEVTRLNYHVKRWLDRNFKPVKSFSLKGIFAD